MSSSKSIPWLRAVGVWLALMAVEVVHGVLRTILLTPRVGDVRAGQISVFTGTLLIIAVTYLLVSRLRTVSSRALLMTGLLWVALTLAFEVGLGRALGLSWQRIGADYDLRQGGLMPLGLTALALAPWLAARLHEHRHRHSTTQ